MRRNAVELAVNSGPQTEYPLPAKREEAAPNLAYVGWHC